MIERMDVFRALAARRTDEIVVITMSATRQWPVVSNNRDLDFDFLAFGMGHAADFGMGLALARPERKVIVLMGDGGILMSLGSLVTIGRYGPPNLVVVLLENRVYEMTGGQEFSDRADFAALGSASGIEKVQRLETLDEIKAEWPGILTVPGPHFVIVPVENSEPLPPVSHTDHTSRILNLRSALGLD